MTAGFAFLTIGTLVLYSAYRNVSVADVMQGFTKSNNGGPGFTGFVSVLTAARSGLVESVTPGGGGKVDPKGKVSGHPELKPGIAAVAATVLRQFPGLTITSTTGGSHAVDSYHYQGRAVDIGGSSDEMNKAALWIKKYLGHLLAEGIHNPGLSIDSRKEVPSSFWGAETWAGHADHIHLAV